MMFEKANRESKSIVKHTIFLTGNYQDDSVQISIKPIKDHDTYFIITNSKTKDIQIEHSWEEVKTYINANYSINNIEEFDDYVKEFLVIEEL